MKCDDCEKSGMDNRDNKVLKVDIRKIPAGHRDTKFIKRACLCSWHRRRYLDKGFFVDLPDRVGGWDLAELE